MRGERREITRPGRPNSTTAPGPIDAVQDFVPPSVPASIVRAAILAIRSNGRAALMGDVGMLGGENMTLGR